jgi:hypothetical protein
MSPELSQFWIKPVRRWQLSTSEQFGHFRPFFPPFPFPVLQFSEQNPVPKASLARHRRMSNPTSGLKTNFPVPTNPARN